MTRRSLATFQRSPELAGKDKGFRGIKPANMPWEIFLACYDGKKIDHDILLRLDRDMSLAEMYDLIELREVADSWAHAYHLNNPVKEP